MKIGIVGYQGSGKSTLFHWLTGKEPDPALAHATQSDMCTVPEPRIADLSKIYHPKKITEAKLEIVDTPGLARTHEGSAQKLAMIREAGALIVVVANFGGADARTDLRNFDDDLLIADLDIITGRVTRLRDQVKKPRSDREEMQKELEAIEPLLVELENGRPLANFPMSVEQKKATRSFQLFSEKPRLVIVNISDDDDKPERFQELARPGMELHAMSLTLQRDLAGMPAEERQAFCTEMGV